MGELMPDLDGVEIQDERPWVWDQSVVVEGKAAAEREEEKEVLRTQNWRGSGGQNRLFREPVVLFRGVQRGAGRWPCACLAVSVLDVRRSVERRWPKLGPTEECEPAECGETSKTLDVLIT
jgi:hypothetical protein